MYILEEFSGNHVLVTHTSQKYRARHIAADMVEASKVVADLNRPAKLAQLATHRFNVEVGGIDFNGIRVCTKRESQSALANSLRGLQEGYETTIDWKGENGWVQITLVEATAISQAAFSHVKNAFSAEMAVENQINAIDDHEALQAFDVEAAFNQVMGIVLDEATGTYGPVSVEE